MDGKWKFLKEKIIVRFLNLYLFVRFVLLEEEFVEILRLILDILML